MLQVKVFRAERSEWDAWNGQMRERGSAVASGLDRVRGALKGRGVVLELTED